MKRTDVVAIGLMTLIAACAPAAPKTDPAADLAAITKVRASYVAAFKAGNPAGIGGVYTADGSDMNNAQPTVVGADAITAATKAMMDQMSAQDIVLTSEKLEIAGDMAYDRGTYKTTMTPKAGGAPMVEEGRYLVVVKRQADGAWKLVAGMSNLPTAPVAAPAAAPAKAPAKAPGKAPAKAPAKAPTKKG